jgi:ATP-dependent DNA helicase RecG
VTQARRPPRAPAAARPAAAGRAASAASTERFRNVLQLELKRGCDNGAVIGGLDRFLANARTDRALARLIDQASALGSAGYAGLTRVERRAWLRALLDGKARAAPAAKPVAKKEAVPAEERDPLTLPVTVVRGIKEALQARLAKLDVRSVRDLLYLFPNRYNDFASVRPIAELEVGKDQTVRATVWRATPVRLGRRDGAEALVGDATGTMRVVWFNQPYIASQLHPDDEVVLAGKVTVYNGHKTIESPEWERVQGDDLTHTGRLVPVYPLTQGLSQRVLRKAVKEAVDRFAAAVPEALPDDLRERRDLPGVVAALRQIHYPDSLDDREAARRRFAFEELLCVQLAVMERRAAWEHGRAPRLADRGLIDRYRAGLPFRLTGAQERVLAEVLADIGGTRPMARLLQGDVGSGKTAVAAAALAVAVASGYQGALMAPTEILAEQHYRTLANLLAGLSIAGRPLRIELLTGSQTPAQKRELAAAIGTGDVDIAVGTHALIQEGVSFAHLGLTVVDEQHRFGVMQRAALRDRVLSPAPDGRAGNETSTPHLLVMSATPIPRTLALTLYGDLDVSTIDEMPAGRLPVKTTWLSPLERQDAYDFLRERIGEGRQAFVVCPLIEESEALAVRSATQEYEHLSREVYPDLRLALLHGRVPSQEKDAVLGAFRRGETDILVATTVIEVGIDIPNATVMLIEGADRFGLAQLHQLRGRVGRGADQSYCLLLSDDPSPTAKERLQLLETTNDGFALAEADLRLRGPGDYLGTRQSGLPEFQAADFSDVRMVEDARAEAARLLAADPGLRAPAHAVLAAAVQRTKRAVIGDVS